MNSNNILNFQEYTTILNACTKKSGNLLKAPLKFVEVSLYYALVLAYETSSNVFEPHWMASVLVNTNQMT